jgi:16S rRNA (adenine1518-N6/adenine1519-N6)-dimethyltransferase
VPRPPFKPKRSRTSRPLNEAGHVANKALGQHFLQDRAVLDRIVGAGHLEGDETVIEVGAGLGALTERLAPRVRRLFAVEVDPGLAAHLRRRFASNGTVALIETDVLGLDPATLVGDGPYDVFGNLPYNIGTAVLRHFLESTPRPRRLIVMLQREVAAAVVAKPGEMSLVSVSTQVYANATRLFDVSPAAFSPPPKVHSSVIRLDTLPEPRVPEADRESFFSLVRAGFSAPRKTLRNSLAQGLQVAPAEAEALLVAAELDPELRPQTLSVDGWLALHDAWKAAS